MSSRHHHHPSLLLGLALPWFMLACAEDTATNQPPTFVDAPSRLNAKVGQLLDVVIPIRDPDGDTLSLSIAEGRPLARFEPVTDGGRLVWSPQGSEVGESTWVLTAEDGQGGAATHNIAVIVAPADGAPEFVTGPQHILDLGVEDTLTARIEVKDDDSLEVILTLRDNPDGMQFDQDMPKGGLLHWTPSASQIAERLVWSATLEADDRAGGITAQELSIILVGVSSCVGGCACEPPTIEHEPLVDQEGTEDYLITATIFDRESSIRNATLFWSLGDPNDRSTFRSEPMRTEAQGQFVADIPNPVVLADRSERVAYTICATDDDDRGGDACDATRCVPETGAYQFVATPPGGEQLCQEDTAEPNNTIEQATPLSPPLVVDALTLCDGDTDHYAIALSMQQTLYVSLSNGEGLDMALFGPEETQVAQSTGGQLVYTAERDALHTVRIDLDHPERAEPDYALVAEVCTNDVYEPNNTAEHASSLGDGLILDGALCLGEQDVFRVPVGELGGLIEAEMQVLSPLDGDVNDVAAIVLFDTDGTTPLADGVGAGDSIRVLHEVLDEGVYFIAVQARTRETIALIYDLLVIVD